ncbi:hypothetical protein BGZ76_002564 [Entomortierella beljakovae]|nr:hypothetical protein BGZ76_002564 [Entomortierella beljakovae]
MEGYSGNAANRVWRVIISSGMMKLTRIKHRVLGLAISRGKDKDMDKDKDLRQHINRNAISATRKVTLQTRARIQVDQSTQVDEMDQVLQQRQRPRQQVKKRYPRVESRQYELVGNHELYRNIASL